MKRRTLLISVLFCCSVLFLPTPEVVAGDQDWGGGWRSITGPGGVTPLPKDLSVDDVRHMMEHYVAWEYHGRLKLGKIEVRDADIIVVDFTTPDGYLVKRLDVNRHTGQVRPAK